MENINHILQEQEEIGSAIFALIDNRNVFTVPEGYFDELALKVLGKIGNIDETVPENYFEELPTQVLGKLVESPSVPEGYFDSLAIEVLGKINKVEDEEEIPAGYFEGLSDRILQKIKLDEKEINVLEEMETLSPAIAKIGNQHPFTVPAGYFENNIQSINEKLAVKPLAPIVQMGSARKVLRYAVAAVVTALLGLGIYNVTFKEDNATMNTVVLAQAEKIIETNSIDEVFNSLTEADITDYMTSKGSNINAALVASTINDADLPTPVDYLLDENALNDFLKGKNIIN